MLTNTRLRDYKLKSADDKSNASTAQVIAKETNDNNEIEILLYPQQKV